VDPNSFGGIFDGYLMGFASNVAFPGGPPTPGVLAGTAVPPANQNNGVNAAIIFQATRVSTIAAVNGGAAPDYTNQVDVIHINNWEEVNLLNFAEFATGCCTPIDKTLSVQFTADHEQMAGGEWSLVISSCALPSNIDLVDVGPIPPLPAPVPGVIFTAGGRGGSGTIVEDTSLWPNCSYTATLTTTPGLTDGLNDDSDDPNSLTFAICSHVGTTLAAAISATDTTINVTSSAAFPPAPFNALLISTSEIVTVTSVAGTAWTVSRGQAGTTAEPAAAGATIATN
jgi:hypothetical protein